MAVILKVIVVRGEDLSGFAIKQRQRTKNADLGRAGGGGQAGAVYLPFLNGDTGGAGE